MTEQSSVVCIFFLNQSVNKTLYPNSWNGDNDLATVYWQSDIEQQDMSIYNSWIGLHRETDENQTLDGWTWPNGENLTFNAWDYGEPDWGQRCGYVNYNSKR